MNGKKKGRFKKSNPVRKPLLENAESNNIKAAKNYLRNDMGKSNEVSDMMINTAKTNIPNVKKAKCKFMLGVCRYMATGEINYMDTEDMFALNKVLYYVTSPAHENEYDRNLNGLSAKELIDKFSGISAEDLEKNKADMESREFTENATYNIISIKNFHEAEEYADYTEWCVTTRPEMFAAYTCGGVGRFYFCLQDGFEDVLKEKGPDCPLDRYGLSMIAVSVYSDGSPNTITCRWNHENGGSDNVMTPQQLSEIIGRNFYKTFLPWSDEEIRNIEKSHVNLFYEALSWHREKDLIYSLGEQCLIHISASDDEIDEYGDDSYTVEETDNGIYVGELEGFVIGAIVPSSFDRNTENMMGEGKYLIIRMPDYEAVKEEIYDEASVISHDTDNPDNIYIKVRKNKKWNVIHYTSGEYVFGQWIDGEPMFIEDSFIYTRNGYYVALYSLKGEDVTGWRKTIDSATNNVFIISDKSGNTYTLYNSENGKLYPITTDIVSYECHRTYITIEKENGEFSMYGGKNGKYRKLTDVKINTLDPFVRYASAAGKQCMVITGADGKEYYIDCTNAVTYDYSGEIVCDMNKPVHEIRTLDYKGKRPVSLLENAETNNIKAAKNYLERECGETTEERDRIIYAVKHVIPNVRKEKYKFLQGVCRLYVSGQLPDNDTISELNRMLSFIATPAHAKEYDRNLNGLSTKEIIERFQTISQEYAKKEKEEIENKEFFSDRKYDIVPINSFEEAEEYANYTDWCVTFDEDMFNRYTRDGTGRFYFCLENGFEDIPREATEGSPLDRYGLSMIAVSIYSDGSPNTITCRWNHANGGTDNVMTPQQLSEIIGKNFYKTFLPWSDEELAEKEHKIFNNYMDLLSIHYEPYEFENLDSGFVSEICTKTENYSEPEDDEYRNDDSNKEIYGYIIETAYLDDPYERRTEDYYLIVDSDLDPVMDELYKKAWISTTEFAAYNSIRIVVQKGKLWNWLKFADREYVFKEWFTEKPDVAPGHPELLIIHKNGKSSLVTVSGSAVIPWSDKIELVPLSYNAIVINGNNIKYYDITGNYAVLIEDGIKDYYISRDNLLLTDRNGNVHIYGTYSGDADKKSWKRLTELNLKDLRSLGSFFSRHGQWRREFTAIDGRMYSIDTKTNTVYDKDDNIVSDEDIAEINAKYSKHQNENINHYNMRKAKFDIEALNRAAIKESKKSKRKTGRFGKPLNEVTFNPNLERDEDFDYFDREYPEPRAEFVDYDDMLEQLRNYFFDKVKENKIYQQMGLAELEWNTEISTVNGYIDENKDITVYVNPYFAEILLDAMEETLKQNPNKFHTAEGEPHIDIYFKIFHAAFIFGGYLALVADQLENRAGNDPKSNVRAAADRFKTAFSESIQSFPKHAWELEELKKIMKIYWPAI